MIIVHCACGEVYKAEDDKAGYSIICTKCQRIIDLDTSARRPTYILRPERKSRAIVVSVLALAIAVPIGYSLSREQYTSVRPTPRSLPSHKTSQPLETPVSMPAHNRVVQTTFETKTPHAYIHTRQDEIEAERKLYPASQMKPLLPVAEKTERLPPHEEQNAVSLQPPTVPLADASQLGSLPTGTNITKPIGVSGRSTLTVINGNGVDAVVKLVADSNLPSPQVAYRYVYLKAGEQYTITAIPVGHYAVLYKLGSGWDNQGNFVSAEESYRFGKPLVFNETISRTEDGIKKIEWSVLTITLHSILTGNVKAQTISKEDFDQPK